MIRLILAMALLVGTGSVMAREPTRNFEQISFWKVDLSNDICVAEYHSSDDGETADLVAYQGLNLGQMQLFVKTDELPGNPKNARGFVRRGSANGEEPYGAFNYPGAPADKSVWMLSGVSADIFKKADQQDQISIRIEDQTSVQLEVPWTEQVGKALLDCTRQLFATVHFDYDSVADLEKFARPIGNRAKWIKSTDYPHGLVLKHPVARTVYKLDISAQGSVTACTVLRSGGYSELDEAGCRALKNRGEFNAAIDHMGQPVASSWVSGVAFTKPR